MQNGTDALTSMRACKTLEVRFRALLTQVRFGNWKWFVPKECGGAMRVFLHR